MSKPPIIPDKSTAGIALDPRTLERVIPESKRLDGSVRKERKVRPGFTPQEDVSRFKGSRQQQLERNTLPKGHILGWVAPSSEAKSKPSASSSTSGGVMSKSAAKNAKRKAKKQVEKEQVIKDNWEDDDEDEQASDDKAAGEAVKVASSNNGTRSTDQPNGVKSTAAVKTQTGAERTKVDGDTKALADELRNLQVK